MKTTKLFFMAALALMTAACSNDDNDFAQQPTNGEITITATLDANDGATTRALSIDGDNIASTWETTDEFAILFNDGTSNVKRTATVSSINGSNVTITFTIPESLANNTACTIVYPASAANAANTGADVATALGTQDGTIGNCPEVRVGTATIDKSTHSLSDVTKLAAQNAIFKFTTKNSDGSATIDVTSLTVTTGGQDYVITPASATSTLFAALPPISSQAVTFTATGSDSKTYTASKASVSFAAGKYYQSTLKMTAAVTYIGTKSPTEAKAVGDIVFSDGSATAYTSGLTLTDEQKAAAVAVIFYAGSASDILGAKTLGVGLKNTNDETTKNLAFARNVSGNTAEGYNTNITAIQCTPSESGDGKAATATFTGDLDGSDNWTALCAAVNDEGTSGKYPAWEWVNAYATTANLTGEYASGWYLPTVAELCMLYRAKDTVNAALEKADGTKITDAYHWSSSQSSTDNRKAWMVKFDSGKLMDTYKGNNWYVCGVRAFN